MKVVCTICSRHKREDEALLAANLRYTSPHIGTTEEISKKWSLPFFILSGKCGLIPADEQIPYYDYYLKQDASDALAFFIANQIQLHGITQIDFYKEDKGSWAPYEHALKKEATLRKLNSLYTCFHRRIVASILFHFKTRKPTHFWIFN